MANDLPDPGPIPRDGAGLIFMVPEYWLQSHHEHFVGFLSVQDADDAKTVDYQDAVITQYQGLLPVYYVGELSDGTVGILTMFWNYYKVEAPNLNVRLFVWAEDEDHVRLQLSHFHEAITEER